MGFFDSSQHTHLKKVVAIKGMGVWYYLNERLPRSYHLECSRTVEPSACEVQLPVRYYVSPAQPSCW